MQFTSEAQLVKKVSDYFKLQGYELYYEVEVIKGSKRADIVGVRGNTLMVVECKLHFGTKVVSQAMGWQKMANLIYVATPSMSVDAAMSLSPALSMYGIGGIVMVKEIQHWLSAKHRKREHSALRDSLTEAHKIMPPSVSERLALAPELETTIENLKAYHIEHPTESLKESIKRIDHHYPGRNQAIQELTDLLTKRRLNGLKAVKKRGNLFLELES